MQLASLENKLAGELAELPSRLGSDGGRIGPSIYATARRLHDAPPATGVDETVLWLIERQAPDGGWAETAFPWHRMAPTLSVIRALTRYAEVPGAAEAVDAAVPFVRHESARWNDELPDDVPIAAELIIPELVDDLTRRGLDLPTDHFARLRRIGAAKLEALGSKASERGSPALYSWEAWGHSADSCLLDHNGSVGTSTAATAAWMRRAGPRPDCRAETFLERAHHATASAVPGVVPHTWPVDRFEQAYGAFALLTSAAADHWLVRERLRAVLDELAAAVRPDGIGWTDSAAADGDDTAVALASLAMSGRRPDLAPLRPFRYGGNFHTYPFERNSSVSCQAHGVFVVSLVGERDTEESQRLVELQRPSGMWVEDKWHLSWVYATWRAGIALLQAGRLGPTRRAVDAVARHQRADGGWGAGGTSTGLETSYAVLLMDYARRRGIDQPHYAEVRTRARRFLLDAVYRPAAPEGGPRLWIGPDPYAMPRLDRLHELTALLVLVQDQEE